MSKDELSVAYPGEEWRRKFVDITLLVDFLKNCVIKPGYRVPDDMNDALQFTTYGASKIQALTRDGVKAKDARVMCLLEIGHIEPLIDIERVDVDGLVASISAQVREGELLFPFIFGRELYDRAASLFEERRWSLDVRETGELLKGTSIGVFQLDRFLIGPYGLLESRERRFVAPTQRVPLFSCSDLSCQVVHPCLLSTDWDSPINDERRKLNRLLRRDGERPSEWGDFASDLINDDRDLYDDFNAATLPYLVGDGFSNNELRAIVVWLLDESPDKGPFRHRVGTLGIPSGGSKKMTEDLSRAQMIQLLLLEKNDLILAAVERLVLTGIVKVPRGEVRRPVVNGDVRAGRFGVQVQVGSYGVRFKPGARYVPMLRLRRLIDRLFSSTEDPAESELDWHLRGIDAPDVASKLDEYLRTAAPGDVVRRLILTRRSNVIAACTDLQIDEHAELSDDDLVGTLLWKIGFTAGSTGDPHADLWVHHERMEQVVRTAGVSPLIDQDDLRARSANYFVKLEECLDDSLAFTTWTLAFDHYAAEVPFEYSPEAHRKWAFNWLNERCDLQNADDSAGGSFNQFGDKNTLYSLIRGFAMLADVLAGLDAAREKHLRPLDQFPKFVGNTELQKFPFEHVVPFLDLMLVARSTILDHLREISRRMVDGKVFEVRNESLHFRRSSADLEKLQKALTAVKSSGTSLEDLGFVRMPHTATSTQVDAWGRRTVLLGDARGRDVALVEPVSYQWMRLPSLTSPQYVVGAAKFAEPNGVLRFTRGFNTEFAHLWSNFPSRRKANPSLAPLRAREEARSDSGSFASAAGG